MTLDHPATITTLEEDEVPVLRAGAAAAAVGSIPASVGVVGVGYPSPREQQQQQQQQQEDPAVSSVDFSATSSSDADDSPSASLFRFRYWALGVLTVSYVHQAMTGFALPAMLPIISTELDLSDLQGALLTSGYSYLYALALVPIGILADKVHRPRLLACGLWLWSLLTMAASTAGNFGELILARVGFAAAQSTQNPISFSLIPELFPKNKSTALALYNCGIYVGRALSYAAVLLSRNLSGPPGHVAGALADVSRHAHEVYLVPLASVDLKAVSLLYTSGDIAAVTPVYDYSLDVAGRYVEELPGGESWRQVLQMLAIPGFIIAAAAAFTVPEPRLLPPEEGGPPATATPAPPPPPSTTTAHHHAHHHHHKHHHPWALHAPSFAGLRSALTAPLASLARCFGGSGQASGQEQQPAGASSSKSKMSVLLQNPAFMSTTFAAALNDVGNYALIAFQATFYERVFHLEPSTYASTLATILPIGGIIGGVGGGYLADQLGQKGHRVWVTAGSCMAAAPFLLLSCTAATPTESFAALLVGSALCEAWRAPSAIMAR